MSPPGAARASLPGNPSSAPNQNAADDTAGDASRASTASPRRRKKPTACRRCHARKVRCSGGEPCENCRTADVTAECTYPRRRRTVKIDQLYLESLVNESRQLRDRNRGHSPADVAIPQTPTLVAVNSVTAPSEESPWFLNMNVPHTPILIGEASDMGFATRFRQAISGAQQNHIPRVSYPSDEQLLTLSNTDCPWPSPQKARLLVNTALKHVSDRHHIVRKSQILQELEQALQSSSPPDSFMTSKLWALFSIGEVYSTRAVGKGKNYPGMAYFAKATRILRIPSERPRLDSVELRLLLSFYSLAINRRHSAYAFVGAAIRLAVVMGLHLNVPEAQLSDAAAREHRNRVWWTAYIFDRMWAIDLGNPVALAADVIDVDLPSNLDPSSADASDFADSAYYISRIRLAHLSGRIVSSIYVRKPRNDTQEVTLSERVQAVLKDLGGWSEALPPHLQLAFDAGEERQPNLVSLHLCFNQSVIVATRPVLLHILRTNVTSAAESGVEEQIPASALTLAEACARCARRSARLLTDCWLDGSFATLDYFYAQYLFSAATILAISSQLDGNDSRSDFEQFESAVQILFQLRDSGHLGAQELGLATEAMEATMATRANGAAVSPALVHAPANDPAAATWASSDSVTGTAMPEQSLQELLAQPVLDLQFINSSLYYETSQGLYWPELSPEDWSTSLWMPN